ncbi:hypothetical protein EYR36_002659 [Pleurotus pulmonarius]|nr:hypothetical protein EYR36_002659 [Pleurotus pulmonarius]
MCTASVTDLRAPFPSSECTDDAFDRLVSSLTFLLWDYIITLPDEIELFWTGRWSYPRVLFFVNRYQVIGWQIFHTIGGLNAESSALLTDLTNQARMSASSSCKLRHLIRDSKLRSAVYSSSLCRTTQAFTMTTSVQLILSLRVYGVYNRATWIIRFFTVLLLAAMVAQLYIVVKLSPEVTPIVLPFLHIVACQPTPGAVTHLYLGSVTTILPDIAAFLLVLLRGITRLRVQKTVGLGGSSLVRLLMRDSILYFLTIVMVYTVIIISFVKFSVTESFMAFGYGFSVISIAASRMLINLRKHRNPYSSSKEEL